MCICARFGLHFAFNLTERRPLNVSQMQIPHLNSELAVSGLTAQALFCLNFTTDLTERRPLVFTCLVTQNWHKTRILMSRASVFGSREGGPLLLSRLKTLANGMFNACFVLNLRHTRSLLGLQKGRSKRRSMPGHCATAPTNTRGAASSRRCSRPSGIHAQYGCPLRRKLARRKHREQRGVV